MEPFIALVALTAMEIVLGIDNIVVITIFSGRLPKDQQPMARYIGLSLAMITRILLLLVLTWFLGLTEPFLQLTEMGIPASWLPPEVDEISWRDVILLGGGLFLIFHSVREIHEKMEGPEQRHATGQPISFGTVLVRIIVMDIVFSLDSVITAVGMVDKKYIYIMIAAIIISIIVMIIFAGRVSRFVDRHPTVKMLALSFLILIGVMLVAEGIGTPINKGYIYFAMAFSLGVEGLNLRIRSRATLSAG